MINKLKCSRVYDYTNVDIGTKINELVDEVNKLRLICLDQQVLINELLNPEPSSNPPE